MRRQPKLAASSRRCPHRKPPPCASAGTKPSHDPSPGNSHRKRKAGKLDEGSRLTRALDFGRSASGATIEVFLLAGFSLRGLRSRTSVNNEPNPMTQIECSALLFDLDGVLIDSTPAVARVWHQWALEHGFNPQAVVAHAHSRPG